MSQNQLKYQDNQNAYELRPNLGEKDSLFYKADFINMPELSKDMQLIHTDIDKVCCFVEREDVQFYDNNVVNNTDGLIENDSDQDLKIFEDVYLKADKLVFKIKYCEKDF